MEEAIRNFPKQFLYEPVIENGGLLHGASHFILCGMGGSAIAPGILRMIAPEIQISVHRDYGLPGGLCANPAQHTVIASSYSGNTEETLSAFDEALARGFQTVAMGKGGKLIERAKERGTPYVILPDTGIQPRSALGFSVRALLAIAGARARLTETRALASLDASQFEMPGKAFAGVLMNSIPVIYASLENMSVAQNWKIKFNETAKIPAFANAFPELNHNEMTGFDREETVSKLGRFHFIFLTDETDNPRIVKRMDALRSILSERMYPVHIAPLTGESAGHRVFSSLILADWTSYYVALAYGHEPEHVPMVEDFKQRIA